MDKLTVWVLSAQLPAILPHTFLEVSQRNDGWGGAGAGVGVLYGGRAAWEWLTRAFDSLRCRQQSSPLPPVVAVAREMSLYQWRFAVNHCIVTLRL